MLHRTMILSYIRLANPAAGYSPAKTRLCAKRGRAHDSDAPSSAKVGSSAPNINASAPHVFGARCFEVFAGLAPT